MQLYQLTQLATQQTYLRQLHELEALQSSIALQERLIDQINQLDNTHAKPALDHHFYGAPEIEVQIAHIEQIKTINALIVSHGWSKCYLHPSTEPKAHRQIWLASTTQINTEIDDNGKVQEHCLQGFAITYIAKEVQ